MTKEEIKKLLIDSFEAERKGDSNRGLELISDTYSVTEMYIDKGETALPRIEGEMVRKSIRHVYQVVGREYDFKHIAVEGNIAFVEFVESYPDSETGKVYRTPIVGVYEIVDGKIGRARHYCDPRISYKYISKEKIDDAFR